MAEKTAMQELHKWVIDKWSDPGKLIACADVSDKIEELLLQEREQILNAFEEGCFFGSEKHLCEYESKEEYYSQTFKQTNQ